MEIHAELPMPCLPLAPLSFCRWQFLSKPLMLHRYRTPPAGQGQPMSMQATPHMRKVCYSPRQGVSLDHETTVQNSSGI